MIGPENLHLSFNQSDAELTNHGLSAYILPCFKEFGGFSLSSHRFLKVFSYLLIAWCHENFGLGFMTLNQKVF